MTRQCEWLRNTHGVNSPFVKPDLRFVITTYVSKHKVSVFSQSFPQIRRRTQVQNRSNLLRCLYNADVQPVGIPSFSNRFLGKCIRPWTERSMSGCNNGNGTPRSNVFRDSTGIDQFRECINILKQRKSNWTRRCVHVKATPLSSCAPRDKGNVLFIYERGM